MLNRDPKLVKLHMGHQIWPNIARWYDFCHTKNLKFVLPPIIRRSLIEGENEVVFDVLILKLIPGASSKA